MPRGARVVLRLRRQFCFHPGRPAGVGKAARHQDIAPVRRNEPQYGKEALSPAIRSQDNRCHDPFLILAAEGTSRQPGEAAGDLFRRASRKSRSIRVLSRAVTSAMTAIFPGRYRCSESTAL